MEFFELLFYFYYSVLSCFLLQVTCSVCLYGEPKAAPCGVCRTSKFLLMSAYFSKMSNNFKKWLPVEKVSLLATVSYISLKHSLILNSDSCVFFTHIYREK